MPPSIYLDCNATTPIDPEVVEAMSAVLRAGYANPASPHHAGRRARRVLEAAREAILSLLGGKTTGMQADKLIFTSGGTEANNLALFGLTAEATGPVIVSPLEHPSIQRAAELLQSRGREVRRLRALPDGRVDVSRLSDDIPTGAALVAVMAANNETGVVQPLPSLAERCRAANVTLFTDAVQAVGKIPVDFRGWDVAALSVTAHKFHGPVGIGALVLRADMKLEPQLVGGFQQAALRPGTESVALAVGFQAALEKALRELETRTTRMAVLRDELQRRIQAGDPQAYVVGAESPRTPHTLNIAFRGLDRQPLLLALDLAGVACSTGSACASGSSEPSPTLVAMGLPEDVVRGSLRFSLGAFTTADEVATAAERILAAVRAARAR